MNIEVPRASAGRPRQEARKVLYVNESTFNCWNEVKQSLSTPSHVMTSDEFAKLLLKTYEQQRLLPRPLLTTTTSTATPSLAPPESDSIRIQLALSPQKRSSEIIEGKFKFA